MSKSIMATEYHIPSKKEFYSFWIQEGETVPQDAVQLGEPETLIMNENGTIIIRPGYAIQGINPGRVIFAQ